MNNSSECLQCGLNNLKKEFEDIKLNHQIEGLRYKTVISSEGFLSELIINELPDDIFVNILKHRGYKIIKEM
jgi:hypothetical protein